MRARLYHEGDWNRAYLHAVGGLCLIVKDELWFYYTGFSGESPKLRSNEAGNPGRMRRLMYAGASTGLATLRRDGFAAMVSPDSSGVLLTRPVVFKGSYFFVNAACQDGELKVELLNENNEIIPGYEKEKCQPIKVDGTSIQVKWQGKDNTQPLAGTPTRFKFYLDNCSLYSFWISADSDGRSGGYVAAGGPAYSGSGDI